MGVAEDFAPSFTQKPQLRQEDEGNRLVFECKVLSSPKPEVTWFRSDTKLIEDNRTSIKVQTIGTNLYSVVLELDDVIESDAGLYKVKAKNKLGEVAASINLNFSPVDEPREKQIDGIAPTFSKKPTIRQEEDGKRLLFECRIQADPRPTVVWSHGGVTVTDDARHKLRVENDGHSYFATLEIENVTVEDAGKYKVMAKNELGESNATISLNFDSGDEGAGFAPSFIEKPRIIPNETGTLISMKCTCTAKPKPSVTWVKGTKNIQDGARFKTKIEESKEDTYIITLEIQDPIGPDSGTYRCHVKNEYGESNANLNLNIEAETEPEGVAPTFVDKPKIRSESGGKLVVMDFKVKADPKPDIVWYHEGKILKETSRLTWSIQEKDNSYYIRLELKDPGIQDSGIYKCNIKNQCGELNANLTLNIEIIPVIKEVPKTVTITKTNTVVIEARVQSVFEPKCTWLKGSSILKQDSRHKVEIHHVKEGEYAVKLEINPCNPNDKGAYKLVAKNEKGEATSSIIDVILPPTVEAPVISQGLSDASAVEGQPLKFICRFATLDKSLKITWTKNNKVITSSESIDIKFDGQTAVLSILECKREHEGLYKISASNTAGVTESSAKLTVTEKFKQLPKVMDIVGSLPMELSHEIFKYLTPFDLGACCSVCRIWRYYANDDMLWRKICLRQRVFVPIELPPEDGDLDPLSPWALAFASYSLRKINNWRLDRKSVHIIATLDSTVVAVFDTMLAYTDELGVVFVYDLSDRTRFVQTIDLIIEEPVTGLGLTKDRLVVRQGDVFTIFAKHKAFVLDGFLVPHEGSYVFAKHNYMSEIAFVRHAIIDDALCILYENSLFIYSLHYSIMHTFKVDSLTFFLHDHHRVYVGTGRHTITGFNSNGLYMDLDLAPSSVVSIKSNEDIIVALVCEEYNSGRYYIFKVWSRKFPFTEFHTSRPFGLEVAGHGSRFASVANDKFGQKVCVTLFDLENKSKYDLDLNAPDPIAQAKLQFLGRDLLYVVTRRDWGPYDWGYLIDLRTMETLYEVDMDHTSVVSIDSSLAVYMNSEAIEINFYNR